MSSHHQHQKYFHLIVLIVLFSGTMLFVPSFLSENPSSLPSFEDNDKISSSALSTQDMFPYSLTTQSSFIEWLPEETIKENTGFVRDLKIVIDGLQNIHVFWVQLESGCWSVFHTIKFEENASWSIPQIVAEVTANNELWMFDVATDMNGNIHLVWENNYVIKYRKLSDSVWDSPQSIASGLKPKIKVDANNLIRIFFDQIEHWEHYDWLHHIFAEYITENNSWQIYDLLESNGNNQFTYDVIVSIEQDIEYIQMVSSRITGAWNPETHQDDSSIRFYHRTKTNESTSYTSQPIASHSLPYQHMYWNSDPIVLDGNNNTLHLFTNYPTENGQQVYYYRFAAGSWSSRIECSSSTSPDVSVLYKTAAIDPFGGVTCIWSERKYINGSIESGMLQSKTYNPITGWSEATFIQSNLTYSRNPKLAFDAIGNTHLVWWEDFEGERTLHYRFGYGDGDGDGLTNKDEQEIYGTDPFDADTDDDQLFDGEEIELGFDPFNPDEDSDLMLDGWEYHHSLNPYVNDSYDDFDVDLLFNIEEFWAGTLPNNNDTDADDVTDFVEVKVSFSDPLDDDTDADWIDDGIEINELGSNPLSNDTDSDGMRDWYEWVYNIKILVNDTTEDPDGDGLWNMYEYQWGINPNKPDHDDDGLLDGDEVLVWGTHPIVRDTDLDSIWDGAEVYTYGTNPLKKDTDDDFVNDWTEITNGINPLDNDTDDDLMLDGYEWQFGLQPLNNSDAIFDYDSDGLTNYQESLLWTNPFESDTDGDSISDIEELAFGSDPTLADTDEDGLDDYAEIVVLLTNVTNPDTDFDGLLDGLEVHVYFSDPHIQDTDGDTIIDGDEVFIYNTDPTTIHSDSDLLADNLEIIFGSNPNRRDTDEDGMDDYWEWLYGLNATMDDSNLDLDNDNVINLVEYSKSSNPTISESDGDGISDYDEIYIYFTHPGRNDSDFDGLSDSEELFIYSTSPLDPDSDDDGLTDGEEIALGTNPTEADTDNDGVNDGQEIIEGTDPLEPKSNRLRNTLIIFISVSSVITGSLLMYYGIPWLTSKRKSKDEMKWMEEGIQAKQQRTKKQRNH